MQAQTNDSEDAVQAVRRFNRFYTQRIGVLTDRLAASPFTLAEARVMYEVATRGGTTAAELCRDLGMDAGYLSRIVRRFADAGLVERTPAADDGRRVILSLTPAGEDAFAALDEGSRREVREMLGRLPSPDHARLTAAMETIERVLRPAPAPAEPFTLRSHRPGDMGWMIHRHGVLYAREYGWDERFEALVAEIAAKFIQDLDPARERCWLAERDGQIAGSVFLVRASAEVAKLRLLLVEPSARGLGIGGRLVDECIRFAREAGYGKVTLWTNSVLHSARKIYEAAGFRLVHEEPHHSFGHDLVGQTWQLDL
ncbi:MAG TPA: helix-turn-helix domain-containing GNAT family N-acetyltransferase [Longimicrobiaceae bacterium]|jgi:DNA-binding MarR family transcriptional regulator/GNAT superfamily N-acetyltransferase|nr:helix-turn-helix domain-containing GNAT family N-acetyltransferase [Longimicrobiaceae bacterium]